MPLISFIIPYYNLPLQFVKECVESVMALGLKDGEREIIVVDDGADVDISKDLCHICPKLVYIKQDNGGLSVARNTGINVAHGEYVQFLDGDDKLIPYSYNLCVDKLRKSSPDLLMFRLSDKESIDVDKCCWQGPVEGCEYMESNNLRASACGYIFKKCVLGNLRFTSGIYHEDEEFTPQLLLRVWSMYYTDIPAYFYRLRESSITTDSNDKHIVKRLDDVEYIINRLKRISNSLHGKAEKGMKRKVTQLTSDYIFNTIRLTSSFADVEKRVDNLRKVSLYPLPSEHYTLFYTIFRCLANSKLGLRLLMWIVPIISGRR